MITNDTIIHHLTSKQSAILKAVEDYRGKQVPFYKDLFNYLVTGFVVSRPTCFAMFRIIDIGKNGKKEPAWFVRYACGDIAELLKSMPGYLPYICFCRDNEERVRKYSVDRLLAKHRAMQQRKEKQQWD